MWYLVLKNLLTSAMLSFTLTCSLLFSLLLLLQNCKKVLFLQFYILFCTFSRNLNVTWELTVMDKSGRESTLEQSRSQFTETSVTLCWSGGDRLPDYQQISTLHLYGVRRLACVSPKR